MRASEKCNTWIPTCYAFGEVVVGHEPYITQTAHTLASPPAAGGVIGALDARRTRLADLSII